MIISPRQNTAIFQVGQVPFSQNPETKLSGLVARLLLHRQLATVKLLLELQPAKHWE